MHITGVWNERRPGDRLQLNVIIHGRHLSSCTLRLFPAVHHTHKIFRTGNIILHAYANMKKLF
jgi:hypothetical protein